MSSDDLLAQFIAEQRSGAAPDPRAYLERAAPAERRELAALIDAFLARMPRRQFDADAFEGSSAAASVDALHRSLAGASGSWPVLLPRLRARKGIKRVQLVAGLAKALGLQTRTEKVASYYHQMEQGLLPAEGVSDRVLAALAGLVDSTLEELRAAGRSASGAAPAAPGGAPAFARTTYAQAAPPEVPAAAPPPSAHECWDEVDELFCGGI